MTAGRKRSIGRGEWDPRREAKEYKFTRLWGVACKEGKENEAVAIVKMV